jgi:prevent-host-death family protein
MTMRMVKASEFKAKCLELMDEVDATGHGLTVTKHGRPIAQLLPMPERRKGIFGLHKGKGRVLGDIIAPAADPEEWECLR